MKLLSKNLIMIFMYMDQFECVKLQTLCKDAYYVFFPKILKTFFLERQYVHLFVANTRSVIVAYLDNYKAKEVSFEHAGVPERLRHFATIQYDNHVLLTGGLNWHMLNPEEPESSEQLMRTHAGTFEFNVKSGRSIEHTMTE